MQRRESGENVPTELIAPTLDQVRPVMPPGENYYGIKATCIRYDADSEGKVQRGFEITEGGRTFNLEDNDWTDGREGFATREVIIHFENPDPSQDDQRLYLRHSTVFNIDFLKLSPEEQQQAQPAWEIKTGHVMPPITIGEAYQPANGFPAGPVSKIEVRTLQTKEDDEALAKDEVRGADPFVEARNMANQIKIILLEYEAELDNQEPEPVTAAAAEPQPNQAEVDNTAQVDRRRVYYIPTPDGEIYLTSIIEQPGFKQSLHHLVDLRGADSRVLISAVDEDGEIEDYFLMGDKLIDVQTGLAAAVSVEDLPDVKEGERWASPLGLSSPVFRVEFLDERIPEHELQDADTVNREKLQYNPLYIMEQHFKENLTAPSQANKASLRPRLSRFSGVGNKVLDLIDRPFAELTTSEANLSSNPSATNDTGLDAIRMRHII